MCGAISPLPLYVFMAWCLVKHRGNFTFYLQWHFHRLIHILPILCPAPSLRPLASTTHFTLRMEAARSSKMLVPTATLLSSTTQKTLTRIFTAMTTSNVTPF